MRITFIVLIILVISCKSDTSDNRSDSANLLKDIDLSTITSRKAFLEDRMYAINGLIKAIPTTISQYGYDSEEHRSQLESASTYLDRNVPIMVAYLNAYGYPTVDDYDIIANGSPFAIIHHSEKIEHKEEALGALKTAWKSGAMKENHFGSFLAKYHRMKFDSDLGMDSPYKESEKIDSLLSKLE